MTGSFEEWKSEIIFTGNITDDSYDADNNARFYAKSIRYIELLSAVNGTEGIDAARAIIRSIQVVEDYGVRRALERFPPSVFMHALVDELPFLIDRQRDWAGEILCGLAGAFGTRWECYIYWFNTPLMQAPSSSRKVITDFISIEENEGGWLRYGGGVLGGTA
jgi:hypothetical protein